MASKKKQTKSKKRWLVPFLIFDTIVVIAIVIYVALSNGSGDTAFDPDQEQTDSLLFLDLAGLGKALAVGPSAGDIEAPDTTIVTPNTIPGMGELLAGDDMAAFISALEANHIDRVLVDPTIVRRHPLPERNVQNTLALAHPAGRLNAQQMSQNLFVYRLGNVPQISSSEKKSLIQLTRNSFLGIENNDTAAQTEALKAKGPWHVILTVRPVQQSHLSYHVISESTLAEAAIQLGRRARKYFDKKDFAAKFGPADTALRDHLTFEMEIAYDKGTFRGPRDDIFIWRIIEPGIYGIEIDIEGRSHTQPPWYSVARNLRTLDYMLERVVHKQGKQPKDYWKRPDVPIKRFRTIHWREKTPGGDTQDLYRGYPQAPQMNDITKAALVASIQGLGDWIADNQYRPDGRYVYRYYPVKDEENDEYNIVRHALGPFSMALTHEWAPNPKYKEKADAGMRYFESHLRWGGPPRKGDGTIDTSLSSWMGKPLPGKDVAILDFPEPPRGGWSSKMGAVAVAILGYTQYKRVGWTLSPEREKILDGLANYLLYMQNEKDGSFHHYYVAPQNSYYGTRNSIYPGEILYAVARLYGETKDQRYRAAFKKSMEANLEWFKGQMAMRLPDGTYEEEQRKNLVQFQPWMAMAMDEMYRYDPDPAYVDASNLVSLWILDTYQFDDNKAFFPDYLGGYLKVLDELPAMHTFVYTEGVAASFDLARRAGAPFETVDKLRRGALLSARFILQQQVRLGDNDYYYPNPKKARGAVRYCMNHNKQRIDYTYHALSSVYRILKATSDDDYTYAQSILDPPRL